MRGAATIRAVAVCVCVALIGCAPKDAKPGGEQVSDRDADRGSVADTGSAADHAGHSHDDSAGVDHHAHEAPHGGALVVLGDELAHVELVVDAGAGSLTAYVLDAEALRGVPIDAPVLNVIVTIGESPQTVALHPIENPLTGEQVGSTSQYQGASELLRGATRFVGSIPEITVKGQMFRDVEFGYPEGNE